jgi:cell division septal protein FtsQ
MTNPGPHRKVNRRLRNTLTRAHLLDVRMRTATTRRRRRETIVRWISGLLLVVAIGTAAFFGFQASLDKFFFKNSEYTLRRVSFDLDEVLTREEALAATGLREGVNIFAVDLGKVEAALRAIPQVQDVRIERKLPDEIDIDIVARRPVAWVAAEGEKGDPSASENSLLVDASGFLHRPRRIVSEHYHLPVIYGVKGDNLRVGQAAPSAEDIRLALQLLETLSRYPESLLHIRTIDVSRGYRMEVVNDTNARILFATADFEEQLARLQQLLAHCDESGRALETVNLMVKRNTPVTFVASATPPPETPVAPPAAPTPQQPTPKTRRN